MSELFQRMPAKMLRRYAVAYCAVRIRWYHFVPWYGYERLRRDWSN